MFGNEREKENMYKILEYLPRIQPESGVAVP